MRRTKRDQSANRARIRRGKGARGKTRRRMRDQRHGNRWPQLGDAGDDSTNLRGDTREIAGGEIARVEVGDIGDAVQIDRLRIDARYAQVEIRLDA